MKMTRNLAWMKDPGDSVTIVKRTTKDLDHTETWWNKDRRIEPKKTLEFQEQIVHWVLENVLEKIPGLGEIFFFNE